MAIALGISVCMVTLTSYRAAARIPLPHKNEMLYAPNVDSWDPKEPYDKDKALNAPDLQTYRDARGLYASTIPDRKLIMFKAGGVLSGGKQHAARIRGGAHDHRRFLPDVRNAVSLWRRLERQGR